MWLSSFLVFPWLVLLGTLVPVPVRIRLHSWIKGRRSNRTWVLPRPKDQDEVRAEAGERTLEESQLDYEAKERSGVSSEACVSVNL